MVKRAVSVVGTNSWVVWALVEVIVMWALVEVIVMWALVEVIVVWALVEVIVVKRSLMWNSVVWS